MFEKGTVHFSGTYKRMYQLSELPTVNSGNFRVYVGEAANAESDRRSAAFDISPKALREIKRRLKESTKVVPLRRIAKPRLCAHCHATLTAA